MCISWSLIFTNLSLYAGFPSLLASVLFTSSSMLAASRLTLSKKLKNAPLNAILEVARLAMASMTSSMHATSSFC